MKSLTPSSMVTKPGARCQAAPFRSRNCGSTFDIFYLKKGRKTISPAPIAQQKNVKPHDIAQPAAVEPKKSQPVAAKLGPGLLRSVVLTWDTKVAMYSRSDAWMVGVRLTCTKTEVTSDSSARSFRTAWRGAWLGGPPLSSSTWTRFHFRHLRGKNKRTPVAFQRTDSDAWSNTRSSIHKTRKYRIPFEKHPV